MYTSAVKLGIEYVPEMVLCVERKYTARTVQEAL